jgi:hypothetical protein
LWWLRPSKWRKTGLSPAFLKGKNIVRISGQTQAVDVQWEKRKTFASDPI